MKRFGVIALTLVLALCLPFFSAFAGEDAKYQFRYGRWDDNRAAIKQRETASLLAEREDSLYFAARVLDRNANVLYQFNDEGKLYRGVLSFNEQYNSGAKYITDYEMYRDELVKLYGKPETDNILWNDENMSRYVSKSEALELGYATWFTSWKAGDDCRVILTMKTENFKVNTIVGYTRVEKTAEKTEAKPETK